MALQSLARKEFPMNNQSIYITINSLCLYGGSSQFCIGDILYLEKEINNHYDDEAIAVFTDKRVRCGYVANSVKTVTRGTRSAGRIYDCIADNCRCIVRFISEYSLIAEVVNENQE